MSTSTKYSGPKPACNDLPINCIIVAAPVKLLRKIWIDEAHRSIKTCVMSQQGKFEGFDSWKRPSNLIQIVDFSACVTLKFDGWLTKKQNYVKLSASFKIFQRNWNWSCSPEMLNLGWNWWNFVLCDVQIWWMTGWPWKTIEHLFYTTLSFVHHFKAMGEIKLELQSSNAQFGSKPAIWQMT